MAMFLPPLLLTALAGLFCGAMVFANEKVRAQRAGFRSVLTARP